MPKSKPNSVTPGVYEHYKSTPEDPRFYQVLGVARNTETDELYANYIPLYVIPEHRGPRLQVRPLDMFLEEVEYKGQTKPRFKYIGQSLDIS